ncbi:hypothetical protein HGG75_24340 [Ochrobactrum pseudogrignonense]|nr:hypothetical protein [Brucella pseudogrignonensis]
MPGIGEVAAIGWVTAALVGVAGSTQNAMQPASLVNTLQQNDVSERMAETYSEALRRGSTLLLIRCAKAEIAQSKRCSMNGAVSKSTSAAMPMWRRAGSPLIAPCQP